MLDSHWVAPGRYWIGIGVVLNWHLFDIGLALDRRSIGIGVILDWYWVGFALNRHRVAIGLDLHWVDM